MTIMDNRIGKRAFIRKAHLQDYASLPMLALYPPALGWVCYQLAIELGDHKRRRCTSPSMLVAIRSILPAVKLPRSGWPILIEPPS